MQFTEKQFSLSHINYNSELLDYVIEYCALY